MSHKIKKLLKKKNFRMQASRKINGNNGTVCVNALNVIQISNEGIREKLNEDIFLALF